MRHGAGEAREGKDHHGVDLASFDGFQRAGQRRNNVKYRQPRGFELGGVLGGVTGGCGYKTNALIDDELHNGGIAHKRLGDVDAEGFIGEIAHLGNLDFHVIELAGAGFDDAKPASIGNCRRQLGPSNPTHRGLHDGVLGAEHGGNSVGDRGELINRSRSHAHIVTRIAGLPPLVEHSPIGLRTSKVFQQRNDRDAGGRNQKGAGCCDGLCLRSLHSAATLLWIEAGLSPERETAPRCDQR